jgi:hypothetical protein
MVQVRSTAATGLPADVVAAIAFEVRGLLETHELAPLRAEVAGLRHEVEALRAERSRQLQETALIA